MLEVQVGAGPTLMVSVSVRRDGLSGTIVTCGAGEGVPYFALFPPVYYSYRVPRTYGYSPFAYPPGILTPSSEVARAAGQTASVASNRESSVRRGRPPLRINNPFVTQSSDSGATISSYSPPRQPKIIYPAAMARRAGEQSRGS